MIRTKHHAFMAEVYDAVSDSYFGAIKPDAPTVDRVAFYSEVVRPALEQVGVRFHQMAIRNEGAHDLNDTEMAALAVYAYLLNWMEKEMPVLAPDDEDLLRAEIIKNVKKALISG